jgi:amino acid transporter
MNVLIMISSLGAINGMIFTTARIYSEFGADHRIFKTMSHWSRRWKTPARALLIQGVICLAMIAGVWFAGGGDPFDKTVS